MRWLVWCRCQGLANASIHHAVWYEPVWPPDHGQWSRHRPMDIHWCPLPNLCTLYVPVSYTRWDCVYFWPIHQAIHWLWEICSTTIPMWFQSNWCKRNWNLAYRLFDYENSESTYGISLCVSRWPKCGLQTEYSHGQLMFGIIIVILTYHLAHTRKRRWWCPPRRFRYSYCHAAYQDDC